MAFQVGTQIRPELGRADLSGFERSGQYLGQAIANVGAQIGEGIEKHYKKKKDADDKRASFEFLKQTGAFGNVSDEALQAGINAVGAGNIVNLYQGVLANQATRQATEQSASLFPTRKELQEQDLLRQKQIFEQGAEAFPLQQQVTQAQLEGMTAGEQRAAAAADRAQELFPFQLESLQAQIAATEQGTEASKAGLDMAERKQKLSEEIAKNTREQNEQKIKLAEKELNLKIASLANQGDSVSVKQVQSAQELLEDEGLTIIDGAIYKKSGIFGGKLTEVLNPSILEVEGVKTLLNMSVNVGSVPTAASENFEGFSVRPVAPANLVNAQVLNSVSQSPASDPNARRAGETPTSFSMRKKREEAKARRAAFLANQ